MPAAAVARSLAALHSLLYYRVSNEKKNVHRSSSYLKVYLLYMDVAAEFRAWILLVGVRRHYGQNCQVSSINHDAFLFFNESSNKSCFLIGNKLYIYCTRAIISRGLYIFLPHFKRPFMYCDLWPYVWLIFKSGF